MPAAARGPAGAPQPRRLRAEPAIRQIAREQRAERFTALRVVVSDIMLSEGADTVSSSTAAVGDWFLGQNVAVAARPSPGRSGRGRAASMPDQTRDQPAL